MDVSFVPVAEEVFDGCAVVEDGCGSEEDVFSEELPEVSEPPDDAPPLSAACEPLPDDGPMSDGAAELVIFPSPQPDKIDDTTTLIKTIAVRIDIAFFFMIGSPYFSFSQARTNRFLQTVVISVLERSPERILKEFIKLLKAPY